ncbi:hypothetical protein I3843_04G035800 [Carya illinoinensis]|uniref:Uncharacterized protein n=1 Tax=Carya illinoinensis TaxID=32201 RepID=A0A8T1QPX1_CARIL|nr:hypothetical protein CIPAW_04G037600 [Carya illinoinensis]KAG7982154.1 hypothetical protein I3843_04G035800 [Carya illinoinensis]
MSPASFSSFFSSTISVALRTGIGIGVRLDLTDTSLGLYPICPNFCLPSRLTQDCACKSWNASFAGGKGGSQVLAGYLPYNRKDKENISL